MVALTADGSRCEAERLRRLAEETRDVARMISLRPDRERLLRAAAELDEAVRKLEGVTGAEAMGEAHLAGRPALAFS